MQFQELQLIPPLLEAVQKEGYTQPTPIQEQAIPHILAGKDLLGCAQTGTGKTAAFALPLLQRLAASPAKAGKRPLRLLVLSPTRELASQISESFHTYGQNLRLTTTVIFGGVSQLPQERALSAGVDILVATPGRLLDLAQQRLVRFDAVEYLVLDEADQMLDMGFIHDVRKIIALLPKKRQNLLFSATMPKDIQDLAHAILVDPVKVSVSPAVVTADKIEQSLYFVEKLQKRVLLEQLLRGPDFSKVLVFSRTKHGSDRVVRQLAQANIQAEAIHGNKSQNARERALLRFKNGVVRVLVATDIAARGLDIDEVSHVINYDLPNIPESYVHRIGRTARAGAAGIAVSFCDSEEKEYLADIERLLRKKIKVVSHQLPMQSAAPVTAQPPMRQANNDRAPRWSKGPSRPAQSSAPKGNHSRPQASAPQTEERPQERFVPREQPRLVKAPETPTPSVKEYPSEWFGPRLATPERSSAPRGEAPRQRSQRRGSWQKNRARV